MLADLFIDPHNDTNNQSNYSSNSVARPPSKRNSNNLIGIINQGATCYLNTLIQTLFLTREFRENLFSLKPEELGLIPSTNSQIKQRVILIELQRLFAQLLYLDQEACSTTKLTESFGWSNNEELQQHDVQELNRILFNAIEQSLVNTSKSKLIQELYRGTCVNKIKCLSCLNIFDREEEFLDIPITVQGSFGLEMSLENSFQMRESLNGNNQYKCEKCSNQYRDAEKYCQLKTLPPILTFSLLRFTYDLQTFQRIKETSCFEFPLEIDLKKYMEDSVKHTQGYTKYELFSIIIHSGSAYGGHYHTYIRDFDQLGRWEVIKPHKENESKTDPLKEVCLICLDAEETTEFNENSAELVNLDYLKYETPLELLKAFIYNKHRYESAKIETICTDLTKITGLSWNKRFKSKYGPIEKFLKKHDDIFELSNENKYVKLKQLDRVNIVSSSQFSNSNQLIESCLNEVDQSTKSEETLVLDERDKTDKYHWFDFDDSKVTPISNAQLRKQFEGKESAYMLFYRRKQTNPSILSREKHLDKIPNWLLEEIRTENAQLDSKRVDFENKLNLFSLECYLDNDFYIDQNVLNLHQQFENKEFKLDVDKRVGTVQDLKEILIDYCTSSASGVDSQLRKESCLNMLLDDESKFYWLLCCRVDTSTSMSSNGRFSYYVKSILTESNQNLFDLISRNSTKTTKLVLILSKHCDVWPIGDDYEPVRIVVKFDKIDVSYTFTKCTRFKQIKEVINMDYFSSQISTNQQQSSEEIQFKLVKLKTGTNKNEPEVEIQLTNEYDDMTLSDLSVKNGEFICLNVPAHVMSLQNVPSQFAEATQDFNTYEISVLNCLSKTTRDEAQFKLRVLGSDLVNDLKVMSISSFNLDQFNIESCHLRFMEDIDAVTFIQLNPKLFEGTRLECAYCGIPLHDDMKLNDAMNTYLSKSNTDKDVVLLLCPGRAPLNASNEIAIKCCKETAVSAQTKQADLDENLYEILVSLNDTRVCDLTSKLCDKLKLTKLKPKEAETYYLKTVDWFGDAESVLNNLEQLCSDVPLQHNDHVLIVKGKLVPINHLKVKLWTRADSDLCELLAEKASLSDEIILNNFIEKVYRNFKLVEELIVKNDLKLDDLKQMIQKIMLAKQGLNIETNEELSLSIRLRLMKKLPIDFNEPVKFQLKKPLIEFHKPLKQLHLVQENDLFVELLDEEDTSLNQGITLLDCIRLNIKTKTCSKSSFRTIMWNTNNGASLNSLKESIIKAYANELEPSDLFKLNLAKYQYVRCQWILLKETSSDSTLPLNCNNNNSVSSSKKKKQNKKPSQQTQQVKSNLKSAPFNLDDGDLIAFTLDRPEDMSELNASHFMSELDLEFTKKRNLSAAEVSRVRRERKKESDPLGLGSQSAKSSRRPEVGISIKIDDFNS